MTKQNIGTVTFMQLANYGGLELPDGFDESPLDRLRTSARADMYAAMMFRPVYPGDTAQSIYRDLMDGAYDGDPDVYHPVPSDVIVFRNDKTASTEAWLVTEDGLEKLHGFWKLH